MNSPTSNEIDEWHFPSDATFKMEMGLHDDVDSDAGLAEQCTGSVSFSTTAGCHVEPSQSQNGSPESPKRAAELCFSISLSP